MATQKKTAEVDYSMQEKILALYDLQKIDSQIDSINKVKGELPLEVQDLDDELAGLKARVENINAEIEELNALSKQRKREVDQAKILIGNYKEQQNNVRNNREFDAISVFFIPFLICSDARNFFKVSSVYDRFPRISIPQI